MHEVHQSEHPFSRLRPETLMAAVESTGRACDGRVLALNSYENRVYQIGIEDDEPLIAKFYRPDRWTVEQIREEHAFCHALCDHELPVVAPLRDAHGDSLWQHGDFFFALFPRRGGHAPDLGDFDTLQVLGRTLARLHAVGAAQAFRYRPALDVQSFGHDSAGFLLGSGFLPEDLKPVYASLSRDLLNRIDDQFTRQEPFRRLRLHGDCHPGNLLWRAGELHLVDFDDARSGPAVQDLWMLLSGDRQEQTLQLSEIVEAYEEFFEFDRRELALIEPLRTLRLMHYSAWLARRWQDPAFPRAFPWFNTARYWGDHILELREQLALLQEPPLHLL